MNVSFRSYGMPGRTGCETHSDTRLRGSVHARVTIVAVPSGARSTSRAVTLATAVKVSLTRAVAEPDRRVAAVSGAVSKRLRFSPVGAFASVSAVMRASSVKRASGPPVGSRSSVPVPAPSPPAKYVTGVAWRAAQSASFSSVPSACSITARGSRSTPLSKPIR